MQKTILFTAFVLVAAVLLSGCTGQPAAYRNTVTNQTENPVTNTTVETANQTGGTEAIVNSNVSNSNTCQPNSVYFIHADWCPHCQKMAPWVTDLETQGYSFVSVTTDTLAVHKDCLTGVAKMQYIPEFVCLSNSQSHVGEFTDEDALKAFADECGAGPQ